MDTDRTRIRDEALPLSRPASLAPLLDRNGDARYVLLGEASHGTAEYHQVRDVLIRRLIEEKGFSSVAVEGDWPDCQSDARPARALRQPGGPAAPGAAGRAGDARLPARAAPGHAGRRAAGLDPAGARPPRDRVVHRPSLGTYVPTVPGQRYDAFRHLDRTGALTPLRPAPAHSPEEQTWPVGV